MGIRRAALAAAVVVVPALASAEVKVQEKSHLKFEGLLGGVINVFGGKAAKEGVTSTVAVKGDRRLKTTGESAELVDLASENLYEIDLKDRTYKVTTFAELRRRMQEEQEKAEKERAKEEKPERREKDEPAAPPERQVEVDFDVKETGQKKTVNGFDARQVVATVTVREKGRTLDQSGGAVITSDMWITATVKNLKEVATFEQRYMEKLHGPTLMAAARTQMAMLLAAHPGIGSALERLQDESVKMDGTPVVTTTTIESVKSAAQVAQASASESEAPRGLGGMLGRKIGSKLGKDRDSGKPRSTLLTMTHEVLSVSPEVTDADVALPSGFKQK